MNQSIHTGSLEENQPLLSGSKGDLKEFNLGSQRSSKGPKREKMSVIDTALTLVASTIGGEIVAVPYAIYRMGIYLGGFTIILVAILSHTSNMMYLRIKDVTPVHLESIFELAYILLGRWAIYAVCTIQYVLNYGQIVLYYIIIGETIANVIASFFFDSDVNKSQSEMKELLKLEPAWTQILAHKAATIIFVGILLLSVIFMRKLRELKQLSYIFMAVMVLFFGLFIAELFINGGNVALSYSDVNHVKFDHRLITAFSIIVFTYVVQFQVFPAFTELKNRSNERFAKASIVSVVIETAAYLLIGLTAILMFGPDQLKPDVLDNLATRPGTLSIAIRLVFCLLLIFDVPFLFFATKEQSLVLHDELINHSISKRID